MTSTTSKARTITRWCAVGVMAAAVVTATADGFAQSYAGLYAWALEHGLHGWKAASFPLMVDLLIVVGEIGLFLLAIDAYSLQRKHFLTWFDFLLPLLIAVAGWTASLIFNVGHVTNQDVSYQVTAAVPPIVSMLGLLVLLRTLHRYVSERPPGGMAEHSSGTAAWASGPPSVSRPAPAVAGSAPAPAFQLRALGPRRDDAAESDVHGGFRLVRLPAWPVPDADVAGRNGRRAGDGAEAKPEAVPVHDGANGTAHGDGVEEAEGAGRADSAYGETGEPPEPEPVPEPVAERAEPQPVRPAAGGQDGDAMTVAALEADLAGNGRGTTTTVAARPATRERLLDELHEHRGDVRAVLEALETEGLTYDEAEARKVRRNNWLPYVVFRLLAQHGGDVDRVGEALRDKGIDCEGAVLDELARSWQ